MKIQILGMGCSKCHILFNNAQAALQELGLPAALEKVEDFDRIAQAGVLQTPALRVDGKVILSGQTATVERLKSLLADCQSASSPSGNAQAKH